MRTIYYGGSVYTGSLPLAEAFAVEDGRFIFAGTNREARALAEKGGETVDLNGRFVCAGFNDSHMHLLNYGYALQVADLSSNTGSLAQVLETMRAFLREKRLAPGQWVRGRGWNHDYFTDEPRFPTRLDLDQVSTEHPVCIVRACGHTCVVNTKALEMIGVTADTPQPEGGCFELGEDGKPNGVFRENGMDLVYGKLPRPGTADLKAMLLDAQAHLNSYGVTSCQTDDFTAFANVDWHDIMEAYRQLEAEGKMTVRMAQQAQLTTVKDLEAFLEEGYNTGWGDEWVKVGPLKILGDGSLGARSAYLSRDYADKPGCRGIPIYTQQQFDDLIGCANRSGMQVAVHAIGDGILDRVLSAYKKALAENPRADHRHGVVHCQITRPDQLTDFAALGLHAYIQPIFLDYDIHMVEQRVGPELASTSYAFRTLMDSGVWTSSGTDCPVELPRALACIQCAVTRCTLKDRMGPYLPNEGLTVRQAIDSYTIHSAHATFEEKVKGRIAPGYLADFVVLGESPFEADPYTIGDIPVLATYVGGNCVYQARD
ncbi:amidohydrolase [Intestinimonas massiliensis (ex Afouda et al. 2020)]|uniref:amidohydrolase n=1 Tax=Intestinimonas massiliensis (ex Afouda et al. 2020) TaxID=1673721 RepID=UPI00102F5B44|nr:amidohydrolase [Intestinimonas massiliensis (ex Afouda et al. 2020)]